MSNHANRPAAIPATPNIRNLRSNQQKKQKHHQNQPQQQRQCQPYKILSSSEILARLQTLAITYPSFVTLTTTQELYNLSSAGTKNDCLFDELYYNNNHRNTNDSDDGGNGKMHEGCNNYVLILQDKNAYPDDSDVRVHDDDVKVSSSSHLNPHPCKRNEYSCGNNTELSGESGWRFVPDVFLSGAVHGNERVGPTAVVEVAELLAEAAHCESLHLLRPRSRIKRSTPNNRNNHREEGGNEKIMTTNNSEQDYLNQQAKACRNSLSQRGISHTSRQWLARLVSTRRTIIIPTANALGYARNEREEDGIDINRDFPFDLLVKQPCNGSNSFNNYSNSNNYCRKISEKCMQSIGARSINELFLSHLFSIGLTYHGGMEVIGYEWGSPSYYHHHRHHHHHRHKYLNNHNGTASEVAPDTVAQETIAAAYSRFGGKFSTSPPYDYGTMNDKVYYVRGGMEDWAFAGSWDVDHVVECHPATFGGNYSAEKTRYNNSTLRAFNMLIETSDKKTPRSDTLGARCDPLVTTKESTTENSTENNGHIARNIRLALLAMDVVEPYVTLRGVDDFQFEDSDVIPGVNLRYSHFENVRTVWVPWKDKERVTNTTHTAATKTTTKISWTVGGAFEIDDTELIYGSWDDLPRNLAEEEDGFYPSVAVVDLLKSKAFTSILPSNMVNKEKGRTRWNKDGPFPLRATTTTTTTRLSNHENNNSINKQDFDDDSNPTFEAEIDTSKYSSTRTKLAVFARAKVDSTWTTRPNHYGSSDSRFYPELAGPVSHIVNARTNPSYYATNAGKIIKGREWWYSVPIAVFVGGSIDDDIDDEKVFDLKHVGSSSSPVFDLDEGSGVPELNTRVEGLLDVMAYGPVLSKIEYLSSANNGSDSSSVVLGLVLIVAGIIAIVTFGRKKMRRERESRLHLLSFATRGSKYGAI